MQTDERRERIKWVAEKSQRGQVIHKKNERENKTGN